MSNFLIYNFFYLVLGLIHNMINLSKLIIIFFICSYLYNFNKSSDLNSVKQNNVNHFKHNAKYCKHLYEYSKIEKFPTQLENGIKMYICKYL